jgi:hypoxanthine phosphoribosyltransferase
MSGVVTIQGRQFKPYIGQEEIAEAVKKIASRINEDLKQKQPVFLAVLNGSFMFASDLLKEVAITCSISFIKLSSYQGTSSTGNVKEVVGLTEDISGRTVVIVEDIVDSGLTVECLMAELNKKGVKEIKVATVLFKPSSFKKNYKVDYIGFEIPDKFVVGYGMDYEGEGRNLKEIYALA